MQLEVAVVVPTFKERANIAPLLERLATVLAGIEYEVIFVDDDSPDQTAALIRSIGLADSRVRVLQRIGRRGLASACVEGMMSTAAPFIAVMDADLQHDETILPRMLAKLKAEQLDLVVATRNAEGGSMGNFSASRVRLSQLGRRLSNSISHCELTDPMSGFFVLDRRFLEEVVHSVSGVGFKILLDLVASSTRPVRVGEIPYRFGQRLHGESKLDILVGIEYLQLLLDKLLGDLIPPRFIIFGMVGLVGVAVHLSILYLLLRVAGWTFIAAQSAGTLVVMILNFFLNNAITYRDRRLRGTRMWLGLLSFCMACAVGAFINLRIAGYATLDAGLPWYAGGFLGLLISSVWNYSITALFTWREQKRRPSGVAKVAAARTVKSV
ncbi:MAG TPA: glycosyltransferase family 2 protein [Bryobacteraceae bacterium]|jgi:dolichol-phosphate mannosyltransferase|nr:glycosyltransferase family 2 protein [Bryobacteraceae bacterium]